MMTWKRPRGGLVPSKERTMCGRVDDEACILLLVDCELKLKLKDMSTWSASSAKPAFYFYFDVPGVLSATAFVRNKA